MSPNNTFTISDWLNGFPAPVQTLLEVSAIALAFLLMLQIIARLRAILGPPRPKSSSRLPE